MAPVATILVIALFLAGPKALATTTADTLDDSLWSKRVVLVFAPSAAPALDTLRRIVSDERCRIEDRDLDIFAVGENDIDEISPGAPSLAGESPKDLRSIYGVDESRFEMVLIGKDGGIKARSRKPTALEAFFTLIDTMPMRRAEIAARGPRCNL